MRDHNPKPAVAVEIKPGGHFSYIAFVPCDGRIVGTGQTEAEARSDYERQAAADAQIDIPLTQA